MDRRDFIRAGAAAIAAGAAARAVAQAGGGTMHEHHHEAASAPAGAPGWERNAAVAEAASDCVRAGEICLEHCLRLLRAGDGSMARCSVAVDAMLAMCRATAALAIQDAPYLKAVAAVCAKACRDCEAACKEHAPHHEPCRRCMETCQKCAAACEKLGAA